MASSQTAKRPDPSMEHEGTLDQTSVPLLLARAWRDKRSGGLQLSMGDVNIRIEVQKGSPVGVETSREDGGFAQKLEDEGLIRPAERMKVERYALDKNASEASAVLALRLLDAKTLYQIIRASTRNQIGETFEWQSGHFQWAAAAQVSTSTKPLDVLKLIQEQLPRRWGNDRLFESLISNSACYAEIPPRFRLVAENLAKAGNQADRTIARLDGSTSIGQILGESAGDKDVAATLWTLLEAGMLRLSAGQRGHDRACQAIQFEVEIESTSSPAPGQTATSSSASDATAKSKMDATSEALRVEVEMLIKKLPDLDHYNALGLTALASPVEIKRAYFKAAKKFHPDALTRLGLDELSEDAGRVFARIAEAFETLSDEAKKAAYDAGGSDEPEIDTARLAQAETSFRKGEILARMGNFQGALEYLEPAVALWPDEPEYQACLGWALYRQPRSDPARAREHLELAHTQSPDDALAMYRLGVVLRHLGESKPAEAMIARARQLDPAIEE